MDLNITVSAASLGDVVRIVYDSYNETLEATTLGDVVTEEILAALRADAGWPALVERFRKLVDAEITRAAPGYIGRLVAAEVAAQLSSIGQGAVTRGQPSTKAQAYVATEVTTQLRAAFAPVVTEALDGVQRELTAISAEVVTQFRRSHGLTP